MTWERNDREAKGASLRIWPLVFLLILDPLGIWAIVQRVLIRYSSSSITDAIEGAYVGAGLFILQMPLCIYGYFTSAKAENYVFNRVYAAHVVFTILILLVTNAEPNWLF